MDVCEPADPGGHVTRFSADRTDRILSLSRLCRLRWTVALRDARYGFFTGTAFLGPGRHVDVSLMRKLCPAAGRFHLTTGRVMFDSLGCCWVIYGVEISPLLVTTIQRLPQRTIDSILPTPGNGSPRLTLHMPLGPSKRAVPSATS
jgi:hypothetical protein